MVDGLIALVAGGLLLFFGKRLFWLAAALVAFLFGWQLFGDLLGPMWSLVVAVVLGILFAWLAIKFIKIAVYMVGFLAGAAALPFLAGTFGVDMSGLVLAIIGGAIGLILVAVAFDWGLILITTWAGASAVTFALQNWVSMSDTFSTVVFLVLMIVGVFWQASQKRKRW
ncbi:MAG: hypothetical protein JSW42_01775 [Chloroflexota bacterium]|nr:MAG: hypothetical protein JSW42_01775 [Chloroflexota bacterium]